MMTSLSNTTEVFFLNKRDNFVEDKCVISLMISFPLLFGLVTTKTIKNYTSKYNCNKSIKDVVVYYIS